VKKLKKRSKTSKVQFASSTTINLRNSNNRSSTLVKEYEISDDSDEDDEEEEDDEDDEISSSSSSDEDDYYYYSDEEEPEEHEESQSTLFINTPSTQPISSTASFKQLPYINLSLSNIPEEDEEAIIDSSDEENEDVELSTITTTTTQVPELSHSLSLSDSDSDIDETEHDELMKLLEPRVQSLDTSIHNKYNLQKTTKFNLFIYKSSN